MKALIECIVERPDASELLVRISAPDGRVMELEMDRDDAMQFSNCLGGAIAHLSSPWEVPA